MLQRERNTKYLKDEFYSLLINDELFFERILEDGLDGICYWDINNQKNKWSNPKFWEALGYSKENIYEVEQNWQSIIHPEDLKAVLDNVTASKKKLLHHFKGTVRYQHKNGSWVWFRTMGVIIRDKVDNKPRLLATYINITNQKESEIHFEELVNRYESVIEGTNIGMWEWNINNGTVIFNERWANILGYTLDEIEPNESTWEKLAHPEDHEKANKTLNEYFKGELETYVFECRMKHKDGHWVWVVDRAKTIDWNSNGKPKKMVGYHQDITERKNNELLLVEYKNLLERTNEAAKIGNWEVNLIENSLYWSDVTKKIHEVKDDYIPLLDTAINFYLEGYHKDTIVELYSNCVEKGEKYDVELQILTAKGNVKWVRAIGIPELINDKCVRVYGLFQDINDYKKAQLELSLREEQFRQTFKHASVGMCIVSIDGNLISANKTLCNIIGYTEEELKKKKLIELSHPDDINLSAEKVKAILANKIESYQLEKRYVHKNGTIIWANSTISAVKNDEGKFLHFVAQVQDITHLKKALQDIAFNEEQFKKTFEFAANGMTLVSTDGKFMKVNRSLCNMLGYTESEFKKLTFQDITHPEDLEQDLDLVKELLDNERDTYQMEKRYFHKDGSEIWALLSVSLVKGNDNTPLHFVSQINNITQRKSAESSVASLLNVTEERNKRLMNFAQIVSHNLRSHSGNMTMLIDLMKMQAPEITNNELFPLMKDAVENLHQTIEHLNEVAIINTKTSENLEILSLYNYTEKAIKNVNALVLDANANILNNINKEHKVLALPAYLDSIILNLITNAIKYRSPERQLTINISSHKNKSNVSLHIQDNGLGIDLKKNKNKLFGMYKTFHHNKDSRGIGLFITKNQVESLNGHIEVESEINKGTKFIINLQDEKN